MNKDIRDIKERLERIEKRLDYKLPYPLRQNIDCAIELDLRLRPKPP